MITFVSLRDAWETNAGDWVTWARTVGHDSYSRFHGRRFLDILPRPGRLTIDLGAGEGRLGRDLVRLGHRVVAIDAAPTLARAAATHPDEPLPAVLADASNLPFGNAVADLVVAFMSLQDIDDMEAAVKEAARVLGVDGHLFLAVVHPLNSAGSFVGDRDDPGSPFMITDSYFDQRRYQDTVDRDGLRMTFVSDHRPLEAYARALEAAGFVTETIREVTVEEKVDRWSRIPLFLHVGARVQPM